MKMIHRLLFGILLFSMTILVYGEDAVLTLYVTRHAQRGPRNLWPEADRKKAIRGDVIDGKILLPSETSITPLGENQCALLGAYLKKIGFNGNIYASPAYRTMQTAVCIADGIDPARKVIPEPGLQEGGNRNAPAKGMSIADLEKRFPGKIIKVDLPEYWMLANEFTAEQRNARMEKFLDGLLAKEKTGKVLLVGHSSTLPALIIALNKKVVDKRLIIPHYPGYVVNCCLYVFKFDKEGKITDVSLENAEYLPEEMLTNNFAKLKKLTPPAKRK